MTGTIDLNILLPELAKRIERTTRAKADFLSRPSRGYRAMPKEARRIAAHVEERKADLLRELQEWAEPMAVKQGERTTIKALQERLSTMISDWEPWYGYSPDYLRAQRTTGLGVQLAVVVCDPGGFCWPSHRPLYVGWKVQIEGSCDSGIVKVLDPRFHVEGWTEAAAAAWTLAREGAVAKAKRRADDALEKMLTTRTLKAAPIRSATVLLR